MHFTTSIFYSLFQTIKYNIFRLKLKFKSNEFYTHKCMRFFTISTCSFKHVNHWSDWRFFSHFSFCNFRMIMKWYVLLSFLQLSYGLATCPEECTCGIDLKGRFQTICSKGGLRSIPIKSLDHNVEVLIIVGTKNYITISSIFIPFKKLEILRINEANIQSIGVHSFWGVQSLRVLGKINRSFIYLWKRFVFILTFPVIIFDSYRLVKE